MNISNEAGLRIKKTVEDIVKNAMESTDLLEKMVNNGKTKVEIASLLEVSEGAVRKWMTEGLPAERETLILRLFVLDKITLAATLETQLYAPWDDERTTADRLSVCETLNDAELREFKRLHQSIEWKTVAEKTRELMLCFADHFLGTTVRIDGTTKN